MTSPLASTSRFEELGPDGRRAFAVSWTTLAWRGVSLGCPRGGAPAASRGPYGEPKSRHIAHGEGVGVGQSFRGCSVPLVALTSSR